LTGQKILGALFKFLVGLLVSAAFSVPSLAQNNSNAPIDNSWYLKISGGSKSANQLEGMGTLEFDVSETNSSEIFALQGGYHVGRNWRIEIGAENLFSKKLQVTDEVELRSRVLSLELIRDFPLSNEFSAFGGAGIGYADIKVFSETSDFSDQDFIWSIMSGFSTRLGGNLYSDSWVQLQNHPSYEFGNFNLGSSSQLSVMTGIRYNWGTDNISPNTPNTDICNVPVDFVVDAKEETEITVFVDDILENNNNCMESFKIISEPDNGELTQDGNLAIDFKPEQNFAGKTSLIYSVQTETGPKRAKVIFNVANANDIPVANRDYFTTIINSVGAYNIPVSTFLENDFDPDHGDELKLYKIDTEFFDVTSNAENVEFSCLNQCKDGTYIIDYTITDNAGGTSTSSLSLQLEKEASPEYTCGNLARPKICETDRHMEIVFFGSGSSNPMIWGEISSRLKNLHNSCRIENVSIVGHSDAIGSDQLKSEISAMRAQTVQGLLETALSPNRQDANIEFMTSSAADQEKYVDTKSKELLNRRAEIYIETCNDNRNE